MAIYQNLCLSSRHCTTACVTVTRDCCYFCDAVSIMKYLLEVSFLIICFAHCLFLTFQRSGYEVYLLEASYKDPVVRITLSY